MTYDAACHQGATEILGLSIIMGALQAEKNLHCVHLMASFLPHANSLSKSVSCLI